MRLNKPSKSHRFIADLPSFTQFACYTRIGTYSHVHLHYWKNQGMTRAFGKRDPDEIYFQQFFSFLLWKHVENASTTISQCKKTRFSWWSRTPLHKKTCVPNRILSVHVLSGLFISSSWLIKSKIKRQRGNNQKQNHTALKENSLQTDLSGKENCCYILHTEKKATSEITTQQTSYIINLQSWQAHLRRKSSFRENYLVLLLMPALVTKSWSRSIQFLQVCCRGSDFKLGNCMQRSVKLLKFQRNLWR